MPVRRKTSVASAVELHGMILHECEITAAQIDAAIQCLVDNGIEKSEAETVLQALGYILLDTELFPESF